MSGKMRFQSTYQQQPSIKLENDSEDLSTLSSNDQLIPAGDKTIVSKLSSFSKQQVDSLEQLFIRKFNNFFIYL